MMNAFLNWAKSDGWNQLSLLGIGSTLILMMAFVVTGSMRRRSAACRCAVWHAALFATLLLPFGACCIPTFPLGWFHASEQPTIENQDVAGKPRTTIDWHGENSNSTDLKRFGFSENASPGQSDFTQSIIPAKSTIATGPASATMGTSRIHSTLYIVVIWLVGLTYFLVRLLREHLKAFRIETSPPEQKIVGVPITFSRELKFPATIGIIRPKIILPAEARDWTHRRQAIVLTHEFAHVQRRDILWQTVAGLAKCLVWFQPLAWLANRRMILERERACDDRVLTDGTSPSDYVAELLCLASAFSGIAGRLGAAIAIGQKPIESRVRAILDGSICRNEAALRFRCGVWLCCAAMWLPIAAIRPFDPISVEPVNSRNSATRGVTDYPVATKIEKFVGKIEDEDGNPISGAKILLSVFANASEQDVEIYPKSRLLTRITVESLDDGSFQIDRQAIDSNVKRWWLRVDASADGFCEVQSQVRSDKALATGNLGTITLMKGRLVRGTIKRAELPRPSRGSSKTQKFN